MGFPPYIVASLAISSDLSIHGSSFAEKPRLVRQRCGEWHLLSLGDAVPAEGVETSAGAAGDPRGMGISLGGFCRFFSRQKNWEKMP